MVQKIGYDRTNAEQGRTIRELLLGRDIFVSLLTGKGKSLCYANLPLAFDWLRERYVAVTAQLIVLVVGPLIALMKD